MSDVRGKSATAMSRTKKPSNIMHKIDLRLVHHAFEETFIDRGLTNSEVLRLLERAKERAKWKQ
jgi:hypothetical protein